LNLAERLLQVVTAVLAANHEANRTGRIGRNGGVGILGSWEKGSCGGEKLLDERKVQPDALSLGRNVTVFLESFLQKLEIRLLEEGFGGTDWVGRVGDDNIKLVLSVLKELEAVANVNSHSRIVEAGRHVRQKLLGNAWDSLVDIHEGSRLDGWMLEDLSEHTTVTTSYDKDILGVGVRCHGEMGDHLLVAELVVLYALDSVIEDENVAVVCALENKDILVLALLLVQDFLDLESHSLAGPLAVLLQVPTILDVVGHLGCDCCCRCCFTSTTCGESTTKIQTRGLSERPGEQGRR
jgi:hypothetical protein